MSFEFRGGAIRQTEEERQEIARQKEEIKASNPARFELLEKFFAFGEKRALLSPELQEQYDDLYEDWFNIMDVCDRFGESSYEQFVTEAQACLALREERVVSLKGALVKIGMDRLRAYLKMCAEKEEQPRSVLSWVIWSQGFSDLDGRSAEAIDQLVAEVNQIDVVAVEQWVLARDMAEGKKERARLRKEKDRILSEYQKMRGRSWYIIVNLCKRLGLVEGSPTNNVFLSSLSAENLVRLEKLYRALGRNEYSIDILSASEEDLKVVMDEIIEKEQKN